jgi:hypothetical protein
MLMKHFTTTAITLCLAALLVGACVPLPAPSTPQPAALAAAPAPAGEWRTYTDAEVGFSLQMPAYWTSEALPDQTDTLHGAAFTGPEGGVEVYWGTGFGGACPEGTEPVELAQGEAQACHATQADGTEVWSQTGYQVEGGNAFSVRAYTTNADPASHDLILQVLGTLTFMPLEQPQAAAGAIRPTGMTPDGQEDGNCVLPSGEICGAWQYHGRDHGCRL